MLLASLFDISQSLYERVDIVLIFLVNLVLGLQMTASVYIFIQTLILIVKSKCKKKRQVFQTHPISSQAADCDENTVKDINL